MTQPTHRRHPTSPILTWQDLARTALDPSQRLHAIAEEARIAPLEATGSTVSGRTRGTSRQKHTGAANYGRGRMEPTAAGRLVNAIFVAIEGPTGVGKTTLATRLATALGAQAVLDPFEANPFLTQLFTDPEPTEALALRAELTFLALRVAQLREIADLLTAGRSVVADWALLKQPIFAATTLDPDDAARVVATVTCGLTVFPSRTSSSDSQRPDANNQASASVAEITKPG